MLVPLNVGFDKMQEGRAACNVTAAQLHGREKLVASRSDSSSQRLRVAQSMLAKIVESMQQPAHASAAFLPNSFTSVPVRRAWTISTNVLRVRRDLRPPTPGLPHFPLRPLLPGCPGLPGLSGFPGFPDRPILCNWVPIQAAHK